MRQTNINILIELQISLYSLCMLIALQTCIFSLQPLKVQVKLCMFITTTNQIINVIKKFIVALCFYIILEIFNLQDYANMSKFYNNNSMKKFFPISHYDMISFQRTLAQIMTLTRQPHTRIVCQTKQNNPKNSKYTPGCPEEWQRHSCQQQVVAKPQDHPD